MKNGSIVNFFFGIFLPGPRNTIRNVTASDNAVGIGVGPNSLVKDCTVQRNRNGGIQSSATQVGGCTIGGPPAMATATALAWRALNASWPHGNTVIGNAQGILVGANSTVTHNTVGNNLFDGIQVGSGSLVSSNTSNDNGDDGIQATCPATITHNTALGNGGLPIKTSGTGCVVLHNTMALPPPPAP